MDVQWLSKVHEVILHSDIKNVESMMFFGFVKGITYFWVLTFHAYSNFSYEYLRKVVQFNIGVANIMDCYRGHCMNFILGLFVLLLLPMVSSKKSLFWWISLYYVWNIIFCLNNDSLLQGILHNTLPVYYMITAHDKEYKSCFRTWTLMRAVCLSYQSINRMISYFNTLTYLQQYG